MATVPGSQLSVGDTTPLQLDPVAETDSSGSSNRAAANYGSSVIVSTSAPLHFGGANTVSNSGGARGTLLPAGVYSFDLYGNSHLWVIAPTGQTVTVERLQVNV